MKLWSITAVQHHVVTLTLKFLDTFVREPVLYIAFLTTLLCNRDSNRLPLSIVVPYVQNDFIIDEIIAIFNDFCSLNDDF